MVSGYQCSQHVCGNSEFCFSHGKIKIQTTTVRVTRSLNKNHTHHTLLYANTTRIWSQQVQLSQLLPTLHQGNSTAFTCRSLLPRQSINSSQSVLKCANLTCVHHTVKPCNRITDCKVYHRIFSSTSTFKVCDTSSSNYSENPGCENSAQYNIVLHLITCKAQPTIL